LFWHERAKLFDRSKNEIGNAYELFDSGQSMKGVFRFKAP
jgi:hypothetical protein